MGKTIADREGKLADDEWKNTQIFLRYVFISGDGEICYCFLLLKMTGNENRQKMSRLEETGVITCIELCAARLPFSQGFRTRDACDM